MERMGLSRWWMGWVGSEREWGRVLAGGKSFYSLSFVME